LLLLVAAGALGLAAGVEPDAAGWLLPDEAHPATAAVQITVAAVRASRPALGTEARFTMPPKQGLPDQGLPNQEQAIQSLRRRRHAPGCEMRSRFGCRCE
jgi:hypothetical protein